MSFNSGGCFYSNSNVSPYRYVAIAATGVDNQVVQAAAGTAQIVGVSDGSIEDPLAATALHATSGKQVRLQDGETFFVECHGTVDAGDLLTATSNGKAIAAVATAATTLPVVVVYGRAMEDGAATKVIQAQRVTFLI